MMYKDTQQGVSIPNLLIWPALGTGLLVLWEFIQAYFFIGRYRNWRRLVSFPDCFNLCPNVDPVLK